MALPFFVHLLREPTRNPRYEDASISGGSASAFAELAEEPVECVVQSVERPLRGLDVVRPTEEAENLAMLAVRPLAREEPFDEEVSAARCRTRGCLRASTCPSRTRRPRSTTASPPSFCSMSDMSRLCSARMRLAFWKASCASSGLQPDFSVFEQDLADSLDHIILCLLFTQDAFSKCRSNWAKLPMSIPGRKTGVGVTSASADTPSSG